MMFKKSITVLSCIILLVILIPTASSSSQYLLLNNRSIISSEIYFNNETELINYTTRNNISGNGSRNDPFLFNNYEFTSDKCFTFIDIDLFVNVTDSTFTINNGSGITFGIRLVRSKNITIKNCAFTSFDYSIASTSSKDITVIDSTISEIVNAGVLISSQSKNITFINCNFFNGEYGIISENGYDMTVIDSIFSDFSERSIQSNNDNHFSISQSSFTNCNNIYFRNTNNINMKSLNLSNTYLSAYDGDIIILQNYMSQYKSINLRMNNIHLSNVSIEGSGTTYGIFVEGKLEATNLFLMDCHTGIGGYLHNSNINHSRIYNCEFGMDININSSTIDNNNFENVSEIAIILNNDLTGGNNNIINNRLLNCDIGITISDNQPYNFLHSNYFYNISSYYINITDTASRDITIYNNSFLSSDPNEIICQDNIGVNWYIYQIGNYWSDYIVKNPTAKITGKGYWNTPYSIKGTIISDNYPLTRIIDNNPPIINDISNKYGYSGQVFPLFFEITEDIHYRYSYVENISIEFNIGDITNKVYIDQVENNSYSYNLDIPQDYAGQITYNISAIDIFNNNGFTGWSSAEITDITAPIINEVVWNPFVAITNESVIINISFIDNIKVDSITLNGSFSNYNIEINELFTDLNKEFIIYKLIIPAHIDGWFNFSITISDGNNSIVSNECSIQIVDKTSPTLVQLEFPDSVNNNETAFIDVMIKDNIGISQLFLNYSINDYQTNISSPIQLDDFWYQFNIYCPINSTGKIQYSISCKDLNNNWMDTDIYNIIIIDSIPPDIVINDIKEEIYTGEKVILQYDIYDNIGIDEIVVNVFQNSNNIEYDINNNAIYFKSCVNNTNDINIFIKVIDFSNNYIYFNHTMIVHDNIKPKILGNYSQYKDENLEITATIMDNIDISKVYVIIGNNNITLNRNGDLYSINQEINLEKGTYDIILYAIDTNNNLNSTKISSITVTENNHSSFPLLIYIIIVGIFIILTFLFILVIYRKQKRNNNANEVDHEIKTDIENEDNIDKIDSINHENDNDG